MEPIQYVGVNELSLDEKDVVDELSAKYYEKVERMLKARVSLRVHVKVYAEDLPSKKFSITTHADSPKGVFRSSSSGWDLPAVVHESFQEMESQIEKTFRK